MSTTLAPFPIDPTLTAIAIAFRNDAQTLIADEIFPTVSVGTMSFKYLEFHDAQAFTVPTTIVGRKGSPATIEVFGTEVTKSVFDYALEDIIPVVDIEQARAGRWNYDPVERAIEHLTDLIMLDREKRVADIVTSAANYASGQSITLTGDAQWSNDASDPLKALMAALDKPIMRPNVVVFGREAWTKFRQHPKIVKAAQGNSGDSGSASRERIADILEVSKILIGDSFINAAKRGQAASFSRTWGKHCALLYINPMAGMSGATYGFTASFQGRQAGLINESRVTVRGSVAVRVIDSCAEVVASKRLGYLFRDAVA